MAPDTSNGAIFHNVFLHSTSIYGDGELLFFVCISLPDISYKIFIFTQIVMCAIPEAADKQMYFSCNYCGIILKTLLIHTNFH